MAENLDVNTYEQIVAVLTRIANNYSNMAGTFYDVFYNPEEKNVTFQMINESGDVQDYTVANLSLSNRYRKEGTVYPEGNVPAAKGTIYQDRADGEAYIKKIDGGSEGWFQLINRATMDGYIQQGNIDPNGVWDAEAARYVGTVEASAGALYINTETTELYIRLKESDSESKKYWALINTAVESLARADLSNVTTITGDGATAVGKIAENTLRQNTANIISMSSTNERVPGAKAVWNFVTTTVGATESTVSLVRAAVEELENIKQDKSNIENGTLTDSTSKYPSSALMYSLLGDVETLINSL